MDQCIDLDMKPPVELGGPGGATNPEQLFAAAFAACLSNSLSVAAASKHLLLTHPPEVTSRVELSKSEQDEYSIHVVLEVHLGNKSHEQANALIEEAQRLWPWAGGQVGRCKIEVKVAENLH